jgi:hypothetical protein
MTTPKSTTSANFVAIFAAMCVLFLIHRAFTYSYLNGSVPASAPALSFLVGFMSDIWVAWLLAVLTTVTTWALSMTNPKAGLVFCITVVAVVTGGLCAHQGYVEFFRFQIEPFHIRYLTDWQFVSSNSASIITVPNIVMVCSAFALTKVLFFSRPRESDRKRMAIVLSAVSLLALVAHNRNIHYRVQWFVPENLQTNLLETLYIRTKSRALAQPLPESTFRLAADKYPATPESEGPYERTLFSASLSLPEDDTGAALRNAFSARIGSGQPPAVIVALLESFRPSETGFYEPGKPSLTPFIDSLAGRGIVFTRAYSTGSVTRGGQEAILCGNASGRSTSLMRNYDNSSYPCLTDLFADQKVHLFWYHGGDGRFDNQEAFWKRHRIADLMTIRSFPDSTPRTGWGVSDKAFFAQAVRQLGQKNRDARFALGLMLSVTNHIPWRIPEDYQGPSVDGHPSWQTTRYTDEAIERLVNDLKTAGQWDSTLLIVVSDHGNKVTPYANLYEHSANKEQLLQSHINLIISGGLAETALATTGQTSAVRDYPVSQTDIAATIAGITGADTKKLRIMGKSLFDNRHTYPVMSQTEDGVYVPGLDRLVPYKDVAQPLPEAAADDWIYRFHFQAVNQYLAEMRTTSR